jgi:hypothetical protein
MHPSSDSKQLQERCESGQFSPRTWMDRTPLTEDVTAGNHIWPPIGRVNVVSIETDIASGAWVQDEHDSQRREMERGENEENNWVGRRAIRGRVDMIALQGLGAFAPFREVLFAITDSPAAVIVRSSGSSAESTRKWLMRVPSERHGRKGEPEELGSEKAGSPELLFT